MSDYRKTVKKESFILFCFFSIGLVLITQRVWVNQRLSQNEVYISENIPLSQNLAIIGLTPKEVETVVLIENFKNQFPQFSDVNYSEAAGFYLSEHPNVLDRDSFYERIDSAQKKIDQTKGALSKHGRLDTISLFLKRFGFLVLCLYPVYFIVKFLLASKRIKNKTQPPFTEY